MKPTVRTRLLASTLLVGTAVFANPAFAQSSTGQPTGVTNSEAADTEETSTGDIVVTGSLISNPNLIASSPVAVVGQDEVQLRQANNAETILRDIPGAVPGLGQNVNNGQAGRATVDLRGFGSNRNIVLLDSTRIVPASFQGAVDLNNIPLALVERVDVLTGGASTTYGADAVSGVVNFITRSDFAGVDAQASEQITERGDGNALRADLDDRCEFRRRQAVTRCCRSVTRKPTRSIRATATSRCSASRRPPASRRVRRARRCPTVSRLADGTRSRSIRRQRTLVPFYTWLQLQPVNIFLTPFKRYNMYGAGHYDVSDTVSVYARGMFSKNTVKQIIAAVGHLRQRR